MDWIEEVIEKWKKRIKNISLRKAMMIYLVLTIFLTAFACAVTCQICQSWKTVICRVNKIASNYRASDYRYIGDGDFVLEFQVEEGEILSGEKMVSLKKEDERLWIILSLIEILCIPVYFLCAIFLVSTLYYKNKLSEPIALLKTEMSSIKRNDLSFSCYYDSTDEMGNICKTMDLMRKAVIDNQKNMWELMEEQRKINAAFAHDLRTPLTVISGYVDMLMEYYPKGQVEEEKMLEILSSIKGQAVRMQNFSETMKEVHAFETLELKAKRHTGTELEEEIRRIVKGLVIGNTPSVEFTLKLEHQEFFYDENIVMEVLGNLMSNALRYGKEKIQILVEQQEDMLAIYVKDDGRGMTTEELYKADSPYYSDKQNADAHFGIGLTICKMLCKKHGGRLGFSNSVEGGAIVCAEFLVL